MNASSVFSLRELLYALQGEQLNNVIDRQMTNAKRLQYEIENIIGLELFVTRNEYRLPTVISICIPNRFSDQFLTRFAAEG